MSVCVIVGKASLKYIQRLGSVFDRAGAVFTECIKGLAKFFFSDKPNWYMAIMVKT